MRQIDNLNDKKKITEKCFPPALTSCYCCHQWLPNVSGNINENKSYNLMNYFIVNNYSLSGEMGNKKGEKTAPKIPKIKRST